VTAACEGRGHDARPDFSFQAAWESTVFPACRETSFQAVVGNPGRGFAAGGRCPRGAAICRAGITRAMRSELQNYRAELVAFLRANQPLKPLPLQSAVDTPRSSDILLMRCGAARGAPRTCSPPESGPLMSLGGNGNRLNFPYVVVSNGAH